MSSSPHPTSTGKIAATAHGGKSKRKTQAPLERRSSKASARSRGSTNLCSSKVEMATGEASQRKEDLAEGGAQIDFQTLLFSTVFATTCPVGCNTRVETRTKEGSVTVEDTAMFLDPGFSDEQKTYRAPRRGSAIEMTTACCMGHPTGTARPCAMARTRSPREH